MTRDGGRLAEGEEAAEEVRIRGYRLEKKEQRVLEFTEPGTYEITE